MNRVSQTAVAGMCAITLVVVGVTSARASGGPSTPSSGPVVQVDTVKISKAYTNATATTSGELLIKAGSSDPTAVLTAYRRDGSVIGFVQNGGGGQYGGTVMPNQAYDPGWVTVKSSSGGSVTVATTPFQV